jgi:hypothetical protein
VFSYRTIRKNVLTPPFVSSFTKENTTVFFYGVFRKIDLLHHPPPLSTREILTSSIMTSEMKILHHLPPILVIENTTTFSMVSPEKTCTFI